MTASAHQAPVSGAQQEQPFDSTAGFRSTPLYPHAGSGAIDGAGIQLHELDEVAFDEYKGTVVHIHGDCLVVEVGLDGDLHDVRARNALLTQRAPDDTSRSPHPAISQRMAQMRRGW